MQGNGDLLETMFLKRKALYSTRFLSSMTKPALFTASAQREVFSLKCGRPKVGHLTDLQRDLVRARA